MKTALVTFAIVLGLAAVYYFVVAPLLKPKTGGAGTGGNVVPPSGGTYSTAEKTAKALLDANIQWLEVSTGVWEIQHAGDIANTVKKGATSAWNAVTGWL